MNPEEITEWIKNINRLDVLHTYCSDILLIRKVTKGEIDVTQYKKQLIVNLQSQIDKFQVTLKDNQDIVNVINDPAKNHKFKQNINTCTQTIIHLEKEIKEIQQI